jgi:hypothetical protein
MLTCERTIYLVLEDYADISSLRITLPGRIARCPVGYLTNHELHRPLWVELPAQRQVEPQPISGVVDDTTYDILRPGALISSKILTEHGHPAVFSSTSGILVQNNSGNCFMTASSHGIGDDGNVWQGDHPSKSVELETSTHPTENNLHYVVYNWCYMGQTEGNKDQVYPPDGTCGAAVWNDNGVITELYHY